MKDIFDTCIYIGYKDKPFSKAFPMSAVVLQELTAGASDSQEVKFLKCYERIWIQKAG